jgi:SNF2 family DNA or RNA helicase
MFVDTTHGRVFIKTRNPQVIHNVLPGMVEEVAWKEHNLAVEHTLETTKILRNIGVKSVPSPILYRYNWPGRFKPFKHQYATADFLTMHRKCFVLNEMGTSKTASALWAADYLMLEGEVQKVLVVAPMSTLERVWRDEVFNFIMHRTAVVLHGSAEKRKELLATDADFYIINYEGLPIIKEELARRKDINLMIIDEAAAYRNGQNERYKVLQQVIKPKMRLWLMTGTPCPNAPTDAWALARLVDPQKVPVYFTSWKRQTMQQVTTYKWKPREGSAEMVYSVLQPAVRFRKKDCLDLPPVTYESRTCEITDEQMKAFRRMKQHLVTEAKGTRIDAVNAADKIGKLRQILCGAIKDPATGEYITYDHAPRLKVLLECIEQASAKVIVIVPFKGITYALYDEVAKHYPCEVVNGDVTPKKRNEVWRRFKHETTPHVVLCHPKVMAHGLTLTEADTLIFYAPIYSNEESQQVMERINRPGQTRSMTIIRMGGNPIEWEIYKQVEGRRVSQENILDLYARILQS